MKTATCNQLFHKLFRRHSMALVIPAALLAAVGLATSAAAAGPVHKITLVMKEFRFEPPVLHLKVGEDVVLTIRNMGVAEHEWAIGRGVVNNQEEKGYRYESGMQGTIVIE